MEATKLNESLTSYAEIWGHTNGFVTSFALRCAVELRVADIINSHGGGPITLSQIASGIAGSSCPEISYLARVMRLLVHKKIFTANHPSGGGETLYGLTPVSRWMLWDAKPSLGPHLLLSTHPLTFSSWHYLGQSVKEGGLAFEKSHGCHLFEFTSRNPQYNKLFNEAMATSTEIVMGAFLPAYKEGFGNIGTLVDVGGGTGKVMSEIVKTHPHIAGINFDLPHVVAAAPDIKRVTHVAGNMFEAVPTGDAILMKSVLHNWTDKMCVKILKNCRKAIPEETGKLIIVDSVVGHEDNYMFEQAHLEFDLTMMTHTTGKERTEAEWEKLLKEGGFPRFKIIPIPAFEWIIEAYPI